MKYRTSRRLGLLLVLYFIIILADYAGNNRFIPVAMQKTLLQGPHSFNSVCLFLFDDVGMWRYPIHVTYRTIIDSWSPYSNKIK